MEQLYLLIKNLGFRFHADRIVLFGSRARGDYRERSDVDIAVFGVDKAMQNAFRDAVEELPTLLDFDVIFVNETTSPALLENIKKDGVVIMNKTDEKLAKLKNAVERMKEALEEYGSNPPDIVRDGIIQRFEFCTELSWKTTREYLIDQGYTEINSPKSVMKQAYADGIIDNETAWISLLNDRNLTSHIYDDATAKEIFEHIKSEYAVLFTELIIKLS